MTKAANKPLDILLEGLVNFLTFFITKEGFFQRVSLFFNITPLKKTFPKKQDFPLTLSNIKN
jgi:hypothetical protein